MARRGHRLKTQDGYRGSPAGVVAGKLVHGQRAASSRTDAVIAEYTARESNGAGVSVIVSIPVLKETGAIEGSVFQAAV